MKNRTIIALGLAALSTTLVACSNTNNTVDKNTQANVTAEQTATEEQTEEQTEVQTYNYEENIGRIIPLRNSWCQDYEACGLLVTQGYVLGNDKANFSVVLFNPETNEYYRDSYLAMENLAESNFNDDINCDITHLFRGSAVLVPEGTYEIYIESEEKTGFSYQDTVTVTKDSKGFKTNQYQFQYVIADTTEQLDSYKDMFLSDRVKNMGNTITPVQSDKPYAYEDPVTQAVLMFEDGTYRLDNDLDVDRLKMLMHTVGTTTWEEYHVNEDVVEKLSDLLEQYEDMER